MCFRHGVERLCVIETGVATGVLGTAFLVLNGGVIVAMPTECLNALLAAIHPPLLNLGIRVIVKLDVALRSVCLLVWVSIQGLDQLVLKLGCHHGVHHVIMRVLCGPVGQVEDLLVQLEESCIAVACGNLFFLGVSNDHMSGFKFAGEGE